MKALSAGSSGQTNGLSSSLAFTPVQGTLNSCRRRLVHIPHVGMLVGIELMNPHAQQQKIRDANTKFFGAFGGFKKVKK